MSEPDSTPSPNSDAKTRALSPIMMVGIAVAAVIGVLGAMFGGVGLAILGIVGALGLGGVLHSVSGDGNFSSLLSGVTSVFNGASNTIENTLSGGAIEQEKGLGPEATLGMYAAGAGAGMYALYHPIQTARLIGRTPHALYSLARLPVDATDAGITRLQTLRQVGLLRDPVKMARHAAIVYNSVLETGEDLTRVQSRILSKALSNEKAMSYMATNYPETIVENMRVLRDTGKLSADLVTDTVTAATRSSTQAVADIVETGANVARGTTAVGNTSSTTATLPRAATAAVDLADDTLTISGNTVSHGSTTATVPPNRIVPSGGTVPPNNGIQYSASFIADAAEDSAKEAAERTIVAEVVDDTTRSTVEKTGSKFLQKAAKPVVGTATAAFALPEIYKVSTSGSIDTKEKIGEVAGGAAVGTLAGIGTTTAYMGTIGSGAGPIGTGAGILTGALVGVGTEYAVKPANRMMNRVAFQNVDSTFKPDIKNKKNLNSAIFDTFREEMNEFIDPATNTIKDYHDASMYNKISVLLQKEIFAQEDIARNNGRFTPRWMRPGAWYTKFWKKDIINDSTLGSSNSKQQSTSYDYFRFLKPTFLKNIGKDIDYELARANIFKLKAAKHEVSQLIEEARVSRILARVDTNKDGKVQFNELDVVSQDGKLTEADKKEIENRINDPKIANKFFASLQQAGITFSEVSPDEAVSPPTTATASNPNAQSTERKS